MHRQMRTGEQAHTHGLKLRVQQLRRRLLVALDSAGLSKGLCQATAMANHELDGGSSQRRVDGSNHGAAAPQQLLNRQPGAGGRLVVWGQDNRNACQNSINMQPNALDSSTTLRCPLTHLACGG